MALAQLISSRSTVIAAFRAAVQRESHDWQDHRFAAIRDQHLEPLITDNERFDRELAAVDAAVRASKRQLDQSR